MGPPQPMPRLHHGQEVYAARAVEELHLPAQSISLAHFPVQFFEENYRLINSEKWDKIAAKRKRANLFLS